MLKIMHTADVHIREYGDERWTAFLNVLAAAEKERCDFLIISGDLLDKDSIALAPQVMEALEERKFFTYIIPGNHDMRIFQNAYRSGNFRVISEVSTEEKDNIMFHFLPFSPKARIDTVEEIESKLKANIVPDRFNILVYHGELLDISFRGEEDFGYEKGSNYMPTELSDFTGFDYVLAGHFHTKFHIWPLAPRGFFVYSGSPVSVTKKELGVRKVTILELPEERPTELPKPREYPMPENAHFERVAIEVEPIDNSASFENKLNKAKQNLSPAAKPIIEVKGLYTKTDDFNERYIVSQIQRLFAQAPEYVLLTDISFLTQHPIYRDFIDKAEQRYAGDEKLLGLLKFVIQKAMEEVL